MALTREQLPALVLVLEVHRGLSMALRRSAADVAEESAALRAQALLTVKRSKELRADARRSAAERVR